MCRRDVPCPAPISRGAPPCWVFWPGVPPRSCVPPSEWLHL
ncbi:hypothetical protein AMP9_0924 [plant metagenome]|uniref:Uncharacterized protein n=1 Tax=plant metagenome TaxID=1297885 RepID=A0A484PJR9_9ZZZZ